ncbi:hypothetical protein TBLA_0E03000 [Henningerozyma blattae CBS 6284]|uniref:DUF676 domain-containing protein n=1 Tax=Henningerozyma blattae (strain ATCC 34711 / CBS 6284 / DSM 70876 / NBRC 10599 / NRRL Y-10934 / UCD 77-7) TaxID=1071380 RepID=I2H4Q2_HENB6|nr:hypothetical protein TBLA_0E03000 [Tetrapisispora blattae CBS 6284]CCH61354.1 hypothetical protein TBLA_0E03000 [Tetrapisispora blattae CBS 6284]
MCLKRVLCKRSFCKRSRSMSTKEKVPTKAPAKDNAIKDKTTKTPSKAPSKAQPILLECSESSLGMGDVARFHIRVYKRELSQAGHGTDRLYLRIRNEQSVMVRPIYLSGPYSLYCDVRPYNYHEEHDFPEDIAFCTDLKPSESFKVVLLLNAQSRVGKTNEYSWTVDVMSQMAVATRPKISYSLRIATNKLLTKKTGTPTRTRGFHCKRMDTQELWNLPPKRPHHPVHLVILTHGIFANIGCDLLYIKDKIEEAAAINDKKDKNNVVVRGFMGNMGKSARGIRYLGTRVGKYVLEEYDRLSKSYKVDRISFIGHSLGGPTETMAIHYIVEARPEFFNQLKPENLVTMASPFLGVIADFPAYAALALEAGALGSTGRDLSLRSSIGPTEELPVLAEIPQGKARPVFESFNKRTLYANVVHDGIVPLRTAALLYVDWNSLAEFNRGRLTAPISEGKPPTPTTTTTPTPVSVSEEDQQQEKLQEVSPTSSRSTAEISPGAEPPAWSESRGLFHSRRRKKFGLSQTLPLTPEPETLPKPQPVEVEPAPPPDPSQFVSAMHVLLAPEPTQTYIRNPSSRQDAVVHDRIYEPQELPPPHYQDRSLLQKVVYPNERANRVQEGIARAWQETMTWRKVLVELRPDSHNNISVRRRFTNLFGAVVVAHLAREHFGTNDSA